MALSHGIDLLFNWSEDREYDAAEAKRYGALALEADASVREVHFALSTVELAKKQVAKSIDWADRAILIDPNYADIKMPEEGFKAAGSSIPRGTWIKYNQTTSVASSNPKDLALESHEVS